MHITVNGCRLYVDIEGAGLVPDGPVMREKPVVVLVHGGPGADHSLYKPAFSQLSDIAQLVYYDHRGNGRSDRSTPDKWTLDQWADDLKGLCDALGLVKPIVCGISFGGFVAQAYATRYPDHPGKLILGSTAAKVDFEAIFAAFGDIGGLEARAIAETYWTGPTSEKRARYITHCLPLYNSSKRPDAGEALARVLMTPDTAMHFNGPANEQGRMDFRASLAQIRCPVLVTAGDRDPIMPMVFSDAIAACLPPQYVRYECFAGCGHGVHIDAPKRAFDVMRQFILGS